MNWLVLAVAFATPIVIVLGPAAWRNRKHRREHDAYERRADDAFLEFTDLLIKNPNLGGDELRQAEAKFHRINNARPRR